MKMTPLAPWNWLDDRDEFNSASNSLLYPFQRMQREMERMVDSAGGGSRDINGQRMVGPEVNISESDEAFHLEFDLPGVKKEDISLDVNDGVLTISADINQEKKETKEGYVCSERRSGHVERSFNLEGIDADNIKADYRNGVLLVTLPKVQPTPKKEAKKIEIVSQENA